MPISNAKAKHRSVVVFFTSIVYLPILQKTQIDSQTAEKTALVRTA